MRFLDLLHERATTPTGAVKFIGRSGRTYYLTHREDGRVVTCRAYLAANNAFEPLRRKVAYTQCILVDDPFRPGRNGVRVYPYKSVVDDPFRRDGLMSAMYDDLTEHGYVVYPANGEVGHAQLQAQSDDAKAFWAKRRQRGSETRLHPVSDAELWGHGKYNRFAEIDQFAGLPVLATLPGGHYPMLVLWQKAFAHGMQQVGIMYDAERGYRVAVHTDDPKYGATVDCPFVNRGSISFYYRWMETRLKASTLAMIRKIDHAIDMARIASHTPLHEASQPGLQRRWEQPLVRLVGRDIGDTYLHGTARKNLRSLAGSTRPDTSRKKTAQTLLDYGFPPELNEFHCDLFLSDPRQPQQAHMFAQGKSSALAVVRLKPGTKILDLSDEVTRAQTYAWGEGPTVLRFFHRPAITDALIRWQEGRIVDGYKARHPDWREKLHAQMDPASPSFWVQSWQDTLVPWARAHGFGAIRFADELLVTDRSVLRDARLATSAECEAAATTRTWPGAHRAGLFTDQPTGAHDEAEQALRSQDE